MDNKGVRIGDAVFIRMTNIWLPGVICGYNKTEIGIKYYSGRTIAITWCKKNDTSKWKRMSISEELLQNVQATKNDRKRIKKGALLSSISSVYHNDKDFRRLNIPYEYSNNRVYSYYGSYSYWTEPEEEIVEKEKEEVEEIYPEDIKKKNRKAKPIPISEFQHYVNFVCEKLRKDNDNNKKEENYKLQNEIKTTVRHPRSYLLNYIKYQSRNISHDHVFSFHSGGEYYDYGSQFDYFDDYHSDYSVDSNDPYDFRPTSNGKRNNNIIDDDDYFGVVENIKKKDKREVKKEVNIERREKEKIDNFLSAIKVDVSGSDVSSNSEYLSPRSFHTPSQSQTNENNEFYSCEDNQSWTRELVNENKKIIMEEKIEVEEPSSYSSPTSFFYEIPAQTRGISSYDVPSINDFDIRAMEHTLEQFHIPIGSDNVNQFQHFSETYKVAEWDTLSVESFRSPSECSFIDLFA